MPRVTDRRVRDLWEGLSRSQLDVLRTKGLMRYEVRWHRDGKSGRKRFHGKRQAELWEAQQRIGPAEQLDRRGRTLTVEQMMDLWLATKANLPGLKTDEACRTDHREVLLTFSGRLASTVTPSEVFVWVARDRGISLRRRSLTALRRAYAIAIGDRLLRDDPTANVSLPKARSQEMRFLSWEELADIADHCGDGTMVWLLGTVGLRLGEAVGLKVGDVNTRTRRIRIARQITMRDNRPTEGLPKGGKGRDVPVPGFVLDMLPLHGRRPGDWLFHGIRSSRLDAHFWRGKVFEPAAERAGYGKMHPHELRHTAASLAIAAGADVGAVQRMLGHASASITLNLYRHLFDKSLDDVADALDEARQRALTSAR